MMLIASSILTSGKQAEFSRNFDSNIGGINGEDGEDVCELL